MRPEPDANQNALGHAIAALGARPNPRRFFRADRLVELWKPSRAALALGAFGDRPVRTATLGVRLPANDTKRMAPLLLAEAASAHGAPQALAPIPIKGHGPAVAIAFCDGSVIFGRLRPPEPNAPGGWIETWPGVAWMRANGAKSAQGTYWMLTPMSGKAGEGPHLRPNPGAGPAPLGSNVLWYGDAPHVASIDALDALRHAIDAVVQRLPASPGPMVPCTGAVRLGEPISAARANALGRPDLAGIPSAWPLWLPHRAVESTQEPQLREAALDPLRWLAMAFRAQKARMAFSSLGTTQTTDNPCFMGFAGANGQPLYTGSLGKALAITNAPPAVRGPLEAYSACGSGLAFARPSTSARLPAATRPKTMRIDLDIPTSAHARIETIARFGPWTEPAI